MTFQLPIPHAFLFCTELVALNAAGPTPSPSPSGPSGASYQSQPGPYFLSYRSSRAARSSQKERYEGQWSATRPLQKRVQWVQ